MRIQITDHGYQATLDTLGAELKSFKDPAGKEYVWYSDPDFWARSSPLLFPTVGNVRNDKTIINGVEYPMAKHGFCKDSEFAVVSQSENKVTFSLKDNEETKKSYPFCFELCLTYELQGKDLLMTYEVKNLDDRSMIYHLGAHPGFNCPLEEGETLSDYVIEFEKEEKLESLVYDLEHLCFFADKKMVHGDKGTVLKLTAEMFDNDALYFYHTNSHAVSLKNPSTNHGVHMEYPDFVSIAFWTPIGGNAPFVCLEPWNGSGIFEDEDDNFCNKRDIQTLEAGQSKEYRLKISII